MVKVLICELLLVNISWKVAVNIWFDAVRLSGVKMNSRMELSHKMLMLSGQALLKAQDVVTCNMEGC
jgi:hypothetical protein